MAQAIIDTLSAGGRGGIQAVGDVAQRLLDTDFNINALRTCDVLRKDDWKAMDNVLIEIARKRLIAVQTFITRGLVTQIPDGLGTTILEWEQVGDMEAAEVSMSGVTPGQRDILEYSLQSMPLPIVHKDFNINIRKLRASQKSGHPLDMAQLEMAGRLVMEAVDAMVYNGHATRVGTSRIHGILTEPNRNTGSVTASWLLALTTGASKLADVLAMIAQLEDDNMYGPYGLFIPQAAYRLLSQDYKADSDKTQLQRLLEIPQLDFILPSKDITSTNIVMAQLTKDVMDEVIGLEPTVVQWDTNGGMTKNFKVLSIMVPRVRSTVSGQSGLVHYS